MNTSLPLAIVGSGGAAFNAIQAIRESGYEGDLVLYSDTNDPPINPMLLTYYIAGKIPLENCFLCDSEALTRDYKVIWRKNSPVVKVDPERKLLSFARGSQIQSQQYDACLISSGASPITPMIPGWGKKRVFTLRKIEDALNLRKFTLEKPKKILIVGASMVGIKLVEIFQEIGSEVYLADLSTHVFPRAAHPECAAWIEKQLESKGIELLLDQRVKYLEESEQAVKVGFDSFELEVNLVIFSIGVKSNLDFLRSTEVQIEKGLLVDDQMKTSVHALYAAGDVAQAFNLLTQEREVIALWANACAQGRIAGINMTGGRALYPGSIPQNITHFFDMFFVGIGDVQNYDEYDNYTDEQSISYCFKRKGNIVGYNLLTLGRSAKVHSIGIYRQTIFKKLIQLLAQSESFKGNPYFLFNNYEIFGGGNL